jgi:hypothetical protein
LGNFFGTTRGSDYNAHTVAYAVLQYAMNTETVSGKEGKGNFKP